MGLAIIGYDGKANGRNMVNGVPYVKFNKGVALDDLINKVNNVATSPSTLVKNKTNNKKKQVDALKQQVPISQSYASDYMCCWGKDGKIVMKYVGALKKRQIMRSVWVPKTYVTNPLGPNSIWVPKTKA
jgi:predicted transcriptional regulator